MNFLIRIGLVLILGFNSGFCEKLIIASWPVIEATLYINGKMVGETPFNTTINPGTYRLRVEKKGWIGEEREIIIKKGEGYVFVNLFMRREEEREKIEISKDKEPSKIEEPKVKAEIREPLKIPGIVDMIPLKIETQKIEAEKPQKIIETKIEPSKIETPKIEIEPQKIIETKVEHPKIEPQKTKEEINILILKASSLIEKVKEEGGERYAKERLLSAKALLKRAEKENSFELADLSCKEAELALKETKEKISHYSSSYIMAIFKNIGR